MQLDFDIDTQAFADQGYLLCAHLFDDQEVSLLRKETESEFALTGPHLTVEAGTNVVRGAHGCHRTNDVFGALVRDTRLAGTARALLGSDLYVHQFKINAKAAFDGEMWPWHQDFAFWHAEDGLPSPDALSAMLFLDPVTEFNGPLYLAPGSHHDSLPVVALSDGWEKTLTADLKYEIERSALTAALATAGIVAPHGAPGDVLFFHSNILHGSSQNMSQVPRRVAIASYNAVANAPEPVNEPRPDFLAAPKLDVVPIEPVKWKRLGDA